MILRRRLTIVGACLGAGGLVMGISTLGGEQASQRAATEVAPIEFATGSSEGGGSASNEAADGTAAAAKAPTMPGTQPDAPAAAPTADVASAGDATPGTLVSSGPARPAAARGARSSPLTAGIDTKLTPVFCIADECHPYRQQHDSERPDGKAPSMVAGPVGPRGEAGPRGERGARGARGEAGRAGADGESGPPGQAGPQGLSGPKGDQGERGFTGPAGPRGETGATGPKGDTGARGAKGDTGARGAKGDTGATGPAGPKGDRGPTGATGPEGPAGPTGATGPAGPAGPAGPEGPAGPIGATGPAGPTGATGPAGPTGATGPAGPTGATGPAGPTGATGPAGPAGATWRGGWSSVATYAVNDLVEYEGSTYINIVSGTSVDPPSLSPLMWSLFAAAGTDAPTSAGTAGGDLTGTYPDPQIASGVVGSPEITDGSIGVIDMAFDPATQAELDAYVADDLVCTGCVDATDIGVLNGEVKFQRAAADVMLSSGDTAGFAMFVVKGDGTLNWGDGTVAPDVSLFRGGPDVLQTSDLLKLTGGLECQPACIDTTDLVDASVDSLKVANHTIQPIDLARTPAADLNKGDMQPVAAGTIARVTFTGDMELTPVTMFDPAVDPTKVVIPLDGRYLITAGVGYEGFPFGNNRLTLIHTSGTSTAPISRATGYGTGTFAAQGLQVGLSTQHRLGANDFLQLEVMQDSDATIVPAGTEFSVTWIGN